MKKIDTDRPEQDAQMHPDRKRTIGSGRNFGRCPYDSYPALYLTGRWILKAGFTPGDKVTVVVASDMLAIYRNGRDRD